MSIVNAFTVDLEDWYQGLTSTNRQPEKWAHYEARVLPNTERLLGILADYDVRATFFVLGKVAERYPDLIRQIDAAGHEIGVHGYWHFMVDRLTPSHFAAELDQALHILTPLVTQPLLGHRAPYFSINGRSLWALDVLQEKGFRYDSSFFPTRNMLYGYPDAPRFPHQRANGLLEIPVSTVHLLGLNWPMAGGFYVRTLPYLITRQAIRRLNKQNKAAIMYIHPWELDMGQHYTQVTWRERITHYHGRRGLEKKVRSLLSDFQFAPLRELLPLCDATEQPSPASRSGA